MDPSPDPVPPGWSDKDIEELISEIRPALLKFARARGLNQREWDDAIQEALIKAFRNLKRRPSTDKPAKAYFNTILLNVINGIGRKYRREVALIDDQYADQSSSLEDSAITEEAEKWMNEALGSFDPQDQTIFLLNCKDDVSAKDIALLLDLTANQVRGRLERVKLGMKIKLKKAIASSTEEVLASSVEVVFDEHRGRTPGEFNEADVRDMGLIMVRLSKKECFVLRKWLEQDSRWTSIKVGSHDAKTLFSKIANKITKNVVDGDSCFLSEQEAHDLGLPKRIQEYARDPGAGDRRMRICLARYMLGWLLKDGLMFEQWVERHQGNLGKELVRMARLSKSVNQQTPTDDESEVAKP